jgi:hypothetical protein
VKGENIKNGIDKMETKKDISKNRQTHIARERKKERKKERRNFRC